MLYDHACYNQLQRQDRQENTWYTELPEFGHKSEQPAAYDKRAHLFGPSLRLKTVNTDNFRKQWIAALKAPAHAGLKNVTGTLYTEVPHRNLAKNICSGFCF